MAYPSSGAIRFGELEPNSAQVLEEALSSNTSQITPVKDFPEFQSVSFVMTHLFKKKLLRNWNVLKTKRM